MSDTLKLIIGVIVAANVLYFGASLLSSRGGAVGGCEDAAEAFGIAESQISCDRLCAETQEINSNTAGGPPDIDAVRAVMAMVRCLEERDGLTCPCMEE